MNPSTTLLQPPPESGPVTKAIPDARAAQEVIAQVWEASESRRYKWAQWKGMFDGNAPFSWSKLRNNGQQWRTNFNSLEGKSYKSTANTAYYDLFSSGRSLVEFRTYYGNSAEASEWSRIVSKELDCLVKKFQAFDNHMHRIIDSFVGFGKGYAVFDGDYDWRIRSKTFSEVLFPNGTSTDPDEWDVFVVLIDYPIHTLNRFILDGNSATKAGWNVQNVREAMARAGNKNDDQTINPMKAQRMAQDYDYLSSLSSPCVECAWLYWREYDGTWQYALLPRRYEVKKDGWLFVKHDAFADIRDKIAPFIFEIGDGSINGVNGLGKDIFSIMQIKDRLNCAMIDNVFLRTSVVLQSRTADSRIKAGLALLGGLAVLPQGYDVQPGTIFGDIEGALAAKRDLDLQVSRNTGVYRPMLDQPTGNPRTLGEVQMQYATASQLTTSAINRFYNQLDWMWATVFKRIMSPQAILRSINTEWSRQTLEFRKRLKDAGVPDEALEKVEYVRAIRALGAGSAAARIQTMNSMMPILPALNGGGRQNFLDDYIAANATYAQVERYFPREELEGSPSHDVWEAVQENAALKTGNAAVITANQDQLAHWQTHASEAAGLIQQVSQGAAPASSVVQQVVALAQHAGEHAALVAQDGTRGKDTQKNIVKAQKELEQGAQQLMGQAQQEQQQMQEQQAKMAQAQGVMSGMDPDTQIKAAQAQNKMQLSQAKTQHQMQLRQAQTDQKMAITQALANQQIVNTQRAANQQAQTKKGSDNDND